MRAFTCSHCGHLVFFDSFQCVHCGSNLAFVPELMRMIAIEPSVESSGLWHPISPDARALLPQMRMCANHLLPSGPACNFTTDTAGDQPYCVSCRQTRWLPNLTQPQNQLRANKVETAKRYLFYTLSRLSLTSLQGVRAPVFDFLEDQPDQPVMTGHANGVITLNVAEADDDERARRRLALFEPYRTLLGHLRHESGHFFWDVLIRDTDWLGPCRSIFGDDRLDYGQALQDHYARGPTGVPGWQQFHVSAYAAAHPWEDWAETWAHYLHVMDLMETAASYCVQLRLPGHMASWPPMDDPLESPDMPFEHILQQCIPLTLMLNSLNRSLGHNDAYPFTLSAGAVAKLSFIHKVVTTHRSQATASAQLR